MSSHVHTTACPLDCPDTCSLEVTVEGGRVTRLEGSRVNPVTEGYLCGKVRDFAKHLYHAERLRRPLMREPGSPKGEARFREASWDEALERVAAELVRVRDRSGGEAILPFSYGGSNGKLTDGAVDDVLFSRLGASRLYRNVCAVPTGRATAGLYGRMPGVAYPDFEEAGLIVVWGANPSASGIHLSPYIQRAVKRGARLVVVDPRRTPLAGLAHRHLALWPGTDLVLALALIRWLFENGRADEAFLAENTTGADELRRRAEPWTLARAAEVTRLPAEEIEALAREYAEASPALIRCGWGLERNRNGGSAVAAVLALPAVAGKFGLRGGGYLLSNSRAYSMPGPVAEGERATRELDMNHLGRSLLGEAAPAVELLFVFNANPHTTLPEQELVERGLRREDLFTVVFDQVMTDTALFADVVLPATTFLEHRDLRNGYGAYSLQLVRPAIEPVGEARSNDRVFAELIERTGLGKQDDDFSTEGMLGRMFAEDPGALEALRAGESLQPPFGDRPVQFVDVFPGTPDRRVHLVSDELDAEAPEGLYTYRPDPGDGAYPLALISPATSKTVSSMFGQLVKRPAVATMHPEDAAARGIGDGDEVRLHSPLGEVRCAARVSDRVRPGVVELPKGLWKRHTRNGWTSNALSPVTEADLGRGACFNDARVQVERAPS